MDREELKESVWENFPEKYWANKPVYMWIGAKITHLETHIVMWTNKSSIDPRITVALKAIKFWERELRKLK